MREEFLRYEYPSRRMVTFGRKGMVGTSQQLAAQAGLEMLKKGGNAIDAAIATAITLTVVEPTSNGIGGDAFALVWTGGRLHGLNASGFAPSTLTAELVRQQGCTEMPDRGWLPVTVPGAPSAWAALSNKFGRLPFATLFEPAICYASEGFVVSTVVAQLWKHEFEAYAKTLTDPVFSELYRVFTRDGATPQAGDVWRLPDHAETLREIAATGAEGFYRGALADRIDAFARETGGLLRREDLAAYQPEWVEPIGVNYRGYDVWELPPNGHGLVCLLALNILKGWDPLPRDTTQNYHRLFEAMKLAYADGLAYIGDPAGMQIPVSELLSEEYAAGRRAMIGENARPPLAGQPSKGGTVYLCTADGEGNMVSYIQSNYKHFGSGIVVPGTGIALHDRGANFSLDPESPNCVAPRRRPYHTIIPGFLTRDGAAVGPFGVMGAFMQPQGHLQVVTNLIDCRMNPQQCLDAPRWQWVGGMNFEVEPFFPSWAVPQLAERGHAVCINHQTAPFGRGQMILCGENGVLMGGTEPRADGAMVAW